MEEKTEIDKEPKFRLNRKKNYKGERGWEYTVRADSIEDLKKIDKEAFEQAQKSDIDIISI